MIIKKGSVKLPFFKKEDQSFRSYVFLLKNQRIVESFMIWNYDKEVTFIKYIKKGEMI